jgi:4-amino-4-deoxy-L-arabinose transferase-like glycosyltransferase
MKRFFSNPLLPLVVGACLRLLFVFKYPAAGGDTVLYEQFATNWLKLGKFAMDINGVVTSVDLRMPGYPGFLAVVYALTRRTGEDARLSVMLAQVLVDLATCVVIAALAALLIRLCGQQAKTNRVFLSALWLAALCPFTANYVAVPLTEVWAVFFTSIAFVLLVLVAARVSGNFVRFPLGRELAEKDTWKVAALAGFAVGLGTLMRPETPLLLITTFVALAFWMWPRGEGKRWIVLCAVMGFSCALVLLPWTIRNAVTLNEFQPLAPKDTTLPSEVDPKGFVAWERTWMYRVRDNYLIAWKLNDDEIHMEDLPDSAFDTLDERTRVAMVLETYNDEITWTAAEDAMFAQLARERTARHPLRTYLWVPLRRAARIWFTPRIELLPISGHVFPLAYMREEDPVDQQLTILFFLVNVLYVALALWGAWKLWRCHGAKAALAVLLLYIIVRTAFLTTLETPEPRYVLECFPAIIALGTLSLSGLFEPKQ